MKKKIVTFLLFFSFFLFAESFDVNNIYFTRLTESTQEVKRVKIDDALVIVLPKDKSFFQGFELELKIPSDAAILKNTLFYSFYTQVTPSPEEITTTFSGEQKVSNNMPSRLSIVFKIPFNDYKFNDSPYVQILSSLIDSTSEYVFFRLYSSASELIEGAQDIKFDISVKPILRQEGLLTLNLLYPNQVEKPITITVNEKVIKKSDFPLLLPVGKHHLAIVSDHFRSEVRSIIIDRAKTTNIAIPLIDIAPQLHFKVPEKTIVILNGREISLSQPFITVTAGEHTMSLSLGGYEVVRTIVAEQGKNYMVSLSVDAIITEIPLIK
ncbi:MAG: hypothetical protein ACRC5H_08495 [Treponemataceae bacterium]